jgi:hypothetical protein
VRARAKLPALQDARTAEGVQISPISVENVNLSSSAVTETVFPHRALETQQLWMNRKMIKPVELTTRQMAASINLLWKDKFVLKQN